jgi:hypothetical protein
MSMDCTLYAASLALVRQCAEVPGEFIARLAEQALGARSLPLRKTWHGLHFALTGQSGEGKQPLSFLVSGGKPVIAEGDEEDEAYTPPRVLSPAFVKKLGKDLAAIPPSEFAEGFDLERLSEEGSYPRIWDEPPTDLLREYQAAFESVRRFVLQCAERGDAALQDNCSEGGNCLADR